MAEKNPFPGENNTGHVWDDNLRELKNPPPTWWTIAFWASVIWWVVYGLLYPMWPVGQEPTKGLMGALSDQYEGGWSQIKEYEQGLAEVEQLRAQFETKIQAMTAKEILQDEGLSNYTVASAKVLFGDNCAACHGRGGQGGPGFPVLADDDWLYGGTIEAIEQTISNGRQGVMPAHAGTLGADKVARLAQYVVNLSEGKDDPEGKELFTASGCIACHGMDAKGMQAMGAANLTDAIWRFDEPDRLASAQRTIAHGVNNPGDPETRQAQMPAFGKRLSKDDIKKLAVYVYKFGGGQ
jgi:cytochrome c oxidase cbb3-type subunit 3